MEKIIYRFDEITQIVNKLLHWQQNNVLCFYGRMGVGKTTLIKTLVKELGAIDPGTSPTFGLVNEYENANGELVAYHFDFYRVVNEDEVLDLGIEDYFSSDAYIFIEWPEKIPNLLPDNHHKIHLSFVDQNTRSIEF